MGRCTEHAAPMCASSKRHSGRVNWVTPLPENGSELKSNVESVLEEIGSEAQLAVDANGRFDLETAIAYAKMLRQYPLFWYEETGDPLDYQLQAALAEFYPGAMATG